MEYFYCLNEKIIEYNMFPEYIKNKEINDEKNLFLEILKIIKTNEENGFGSGRNTTLKKLNKKNIITTEAIIRKNLFDMNSLGYIKSSKGRGGSILTSLGEKMLLDKV